ncbi:MAG: hypothetical protein ACRC8K_09750, partial [Waterburya sp.]
KHKRLDELEALEKKQLEAWQKSEFHALLGYEIDDLQGSEIDIQGEIEKLLIGDATIADRVLRQLIGGDSRYWGIGGRYHTIYLEKEQIKTDGGKLIYFQTPEYYQQLDYLSEIAAKY